MKLQQYDQLLKEREHDIYLYRQMKNGDFSHMRSNDQYQNQILAHQSQDEIYK